MLASEFDDQAMERGSRGSQADPLSRCLGQTTGSTGAVDPSFALTVTANDTVPGDLESQLTFFDTFVKAP